MTFQLPLQFICSFLKIIYLIFSMSYLNDEIILFIPLDSGCDCVSIWLEIDIFNIGTNQQILTTEQGHKKFNNAS